MICDDCFYSQDGMCVCPDATFDLDGNCETFYSQFDFDFAYQRGYQRGIEDVIKKISNSDSIYQVYDDEYEEWHDVIDVAVIEQMKEQKNE